MSRPRALVAWSSGKDAAWALHVVRIGRELDVVGLLTTVSEEYGRASMHGVREEVMAAQARAAGLPLFKVSIPSPCPNELYEDKMAAAVREAAERGVTRMIFGDLFLEDIREYRERQLARAGMQAVFPLWGMPTRKLAEEMIRSGLAARITCLDPRKMPRELAGAEFGRELVAGLPADVDPCGENGEFHTCCLAGPMFEKPVRAEPGETVEREGFVFTDLTLAVATQPQMHAD
jgi:uncharacterized protein (TIGR00290 family)